MYVCMYVYIYIYIYETGALGNKASIVDVTANLCTNIMDFGGFDSSTILILSGGILRPIGDFPENLSQTILVGIMLVGRLGVVDVIGYCYRYVLLQCPFSL